jgi:phosphoenolpyruvate---glycerone phosphotransferase subunit DhaL
VTTPALRPRVIAAAEAVEGSRDELCRLDAVAGDGDHGVTMALAARAVRQTLASSPDASGAELVTKLAMAIGSVGGAIGPIYASGLLAIAGALRALPANETLTLARLLALAEAAGSAISELGHAKPGDKTILDALDPAIVALRKASAAGTDLDEALDAAASAARDGAAATTAMIASIGRASRLGERSRGLADPGATSFAMIMGALAASSA